MVTWTSRIILWMIAVCYGYFAFVHLLNIADVSGFDWYSLPLPWQIVELFYLCIDVLVVYGFVLSRPIGFIAFFIASISQFALFALVTPGNLASPESASASPRPPGYLEYLAIFHGTTIALVLLAMLLWWIARRREAASVAARRRAIGVARTVEGGQAHVARLDRSR